MKLIDDLFDMGGGYVLDFNNWTFAQFFADELGIDIDDARYSAQGTSKAKRLRYLLRTSDPAVAVKVLLALWEYREANRRRNCLEEQIPDAESEFRSLIERLGGKGVPSDQPAAARAADGFDDSRSIQHVSQHGGMSLHADVAVPAKDRLRLERLCRYVARPPLASERLEERSDGTLALRLKSRWRDGTTHILMERSELIERLVPLIPPPRAHQARYHGILAPAASQRDRIVPDEAVDAPMREVEQCVAPTAAGESRGPAKVAGSPSGPSGGASLEYRPDVWEKDPSNEKPPSHPDTRDKARRMRWAALLQRVFEVDALRCPRCGATLRLIAAVEGPTVARRILECLKLPARAPPLKPAAADAQDLGPDEGGWFFDQSPAHDEPEPLTSGS